MKLSSLDYALMPSTKLSITALDTQLSLDATFELDPSYPFISFLNVSITEAPACRVRVTPVSESR